MPNTINLTSSHPGGAYDDWELVLTLTHDWTEPVEIFYTLDGTSPDISATRIPYDPSTGIILGGNIKRDPIYTLQAIAIATNTDDYSNVLSQIILLNRPITLNVSQPAGFYVNKAPISLEAYSQNPNANIEIYYTTNGAAVLDSSGAPTSEAILYTGPITPLDDFSLKAVAVDISGSTRVYSNFLDEDYRYEDEHLELTAIPAGGVFPDRSLTITLNTNNPNATIRYTLDGKSPMCETANIYSNPITIATILDEENFHLRAIALTDRLISEPVDINFTLYNPDADSDRDEINNFIEGGPTRDTDADGVPDMYDVDSDADGIPDYIEGTGDSNNNNIPAFQDETERLPFWYKITGLPSDGELVNGLLYEIDFLVYGQPGTFEIETTSNEILISETSFIVPEGESKTITIYVPEVMEDKCSPIWSGEPFELNITVSYIKDGEVITETVTRHYTIVPENDTYPYQGILISWTKLEEASHYNIYRKDDAEYELIATIPHDTFHEKVLLQQYLDRNGTQASWYRVAPIINGIEQQLSNPLHAANGGFPTCEIVGHLYTINNTPMGNVRVTARIDNAPSLYNNTYIDAYEFHTFTDNYGQFVLNLPKGSHCLIKIDQAQLRKHIVVPFEDAINFDELLQLNQN